MSEQYEDLWDRIFNDPDYDIRDDFDEMNAPRTCAECGKTFTFQEAMDEFEYHTHGDIAYSTLTELCGSCAIEEWEEKAEQL